MRSILNHLNLQKSSNFSRLKLARFVFFCLGLGMVRMASAESPFPVCNQVAPLKVNCESCAKSAEAYQICQGRDISKMLQQRSTFQDEIQRGKRQLDFLAQLRTTILVKLRKQKSMVEKIAACDGELTGTAFCQSAGHLRPGAHGGGDAHGRGV